MNLTPPRGFRPFLTRMAVLAVLVVVVFAGYQIPSRKQAYIFDGVQGPAGRTVVPPAQPVDWRAYQACLPGHLAILLTDPDSAWLGLAHGLRSVGVPFCITRDYRKALRHRVVLVYPTISGRVLPRDALRALARFPASGGTLIAEDVAGGGLNRVFGFTAIVPSRARGEIDFDTSHPLAADFTDARERHIVLSRPTAGKKGMGSYGYLGAAFPLARFKDGSAAITSRRIGSGHAYAFGIDLGFVLLTGYNNREQGVARAYANEFEPALDVLLRLLRNIYREGEPDGVTLQTVPEGKALTVLLTHDVDYSRSPANAVRYATYESSAGLRATYFVQAKYMRDWAGDVLLNEHNLPYLRKLDALGMEIASHSVAHSLQFNKAVLGSGDESYPDYRPFVQDARHTEGLTVLGELRVSRFLLRHFLPDQQIVSFRPGHLRNPYTLPQALEATGYRYSSSTTADDSLTHLPFRLDYGRGTTAETNVYEFPVTIEDEAPPELFERLPQAIALSDKLARYGGLMVVLIHPNTVGKKLEFEKRFVAAQRDRAWFGTLRDFGRFWAARDHVTLSVSKDGNDLHITLEAPDALNGLTLRVPPGYRVRSSSQGVAIRQRGDLMVLGEFSGSTVLTLERVP